MSRSYELQFEITEECTDQEHDAFWDLLGEQIGACELESTAIVLSGGRTYEDLIKKLAKQVEKAVGRRLEFRVIVYLIEQTPTEDIEVNQKYYEGL